LFDYHDPIGQTLHVGLYWFTVVGVLENASAIKDSGGEDINNQVFVPLKTAQARYGDTSYTRQSGSAEMVKLELDSVAIQMTDADLVIPAAARMEQYLKRTHPRKDYDLMVPMELLRQKAATQRIFAIVMASIAGISLLIGGIGIMNIMLANVYDRRKEIGMRRALGATRKDIISQFVLEASTLTTLGGLAGVGVGYLLAVVISRYAGWPTMLTPAGVIMSVSLATLTGLVFGLWPARQAALISPIVALRSD
jgi:putative ABC transport system permease protein